MNNELKIEKSFLYNNDLHNKINKKKRNKKLVIILVSLLIIFSSILIDIGIIKIGPSNIYLAVLYFSCMILAFVFFFVFFYNLLTLGSIVVTDKALFSYRGYAITNDNKLITFRFNEDSIYFRYDILKNSLLDEVLKLLILKNGIEKEYIENVEKVNGRSISIDDIYECLNIVNVYNITEKNDCIEINCDYVDLITNTSFKNKIITIYKYFDNWEEILNYLNNLKNKFKIQLNYKDGEHENFVNFVLSMCKNKSNYFFFYVLPFIMILSSGIFIACEIFIGILIIIYFLENKALNYLNNDEEQAKEIILNKLKLDKIFMSIYFALCIIFSLLEPDSLNKAIIGAILIGIFVFIIVRKIKK